MEEKKIKTVRAAAYIEEKFLVVEHDLKSMHMALDSQIHKMREQIHDMTRNINLITRELVETVKKMSSLEQKNPCFIQRIKNWFC